MKKVLIVMSLVSVNAFAVPCQISKISTQISNGVVSSGRTNGTPFEVATGTEKKIQLGGEYSASILNPANGSLTLTLSNGASVVRTYGDTKSSTQIDLETAGPAPQGYSIYCSPGMSI